MRALRTLAGLAEAELADRAGLDLASYQALEAGVPGVLKLLTGDTIRRMAENLDTTSAHLMSDPDLPL